LQGTLCEWLGLDTRLQTIISGGQCGADRGALEAARELGLQIGGWAPKGFRTLKGGAPELGKVFGLREMDDASYHRRTMANVDMAGATVAFVVAGDPGELVPPCIGTWHTVGYCTHGRWRSPSFPDQWNLAMMQHQTTGAQHRPVLVINGGKWNVAPGTYDTAGWDDDARALREFIKRHHVHTLNVAGVREFAEGTWSLAVQKFLVHALSCDEGVRLLKRDASSCTSSSSD
jgi:hypothetical protein